MNPYTKQPSGSYRSILKKALLQAGETTLAEAFEKGELKLAIVHTISGAVQTHPEISKLCITALKSLTGQQSADYYRWGLEHGQFIVASTKGVFVYDPEDTEANKYVEQMLEDTKEVSFFR